MVNKHNKIFSFGFLFLFSLIFFSCGNKNQAPKVEPMFTAADTTEVVGMTNAFMNLIQNKDYDKALSGLFNLENNALELITDEEKKALKQQFTFFPVISYQLESMTWKNVYDVTLVYSFKFMEEDDASGAPNTMTVTFVPQRRNKIWYLAISK